MRKAVVGSGSLMRERERSRFYVNPALFAEEFLSPRRWGPRLQLFGGSEMILLDVSNPDPISVSLRFSRGGRAFKVMHRVFYGALSCSCARSFAISSLYIHTSRASTGLGGLLASVSWSPVIFLLDKMSFPLDEVGRSLHGALIYF